MNTLLAWHFTPSDKRLRYDDNRIVRVGHTLKAKFPYTYNGTTYEKPTLCNAGMHASVKLMDALNNAPGPYLWRVELNGDIVEGDDKVVASKRKALWGFDATDMLRHFARRCALDVIHLWDAPDVVKKFLETGEESLRAAAQAAAQAAAWDAARDAARDAAWSAAWDAARDAARAAAQAAARDAAWSAAWDAAQAAAQAAAWDAAWAAARDAQTKTLDELVIEYAKRAGISP